ncbi:MAG: aldo/keto reductase [bacterium]|nr:aldo/keto reductase [bacterium]
MKKRKIGNSGIEASVVGLGTWEMGCGFWDTPNELEAIKVIEMAKDYGINLIDTAPVYGYGMSEKLVGKAIKGNRDKYVISTKCGLNWNSKEGTYFVDVSGTKIYKYLNPVFIRQEIENSLKRLKTDYIDIYYTHWQEEITPLEDVIGVLKNLKEEGKIRAIGASNLNREILEKYYHLDGIDTGQEEYSLLNRELEDNNMLSFSSAHNISMFAYSPLALGLLTGKITREKILNSADNRKTMSSFSVLNLKKVDDLNKKLNTIAASYKISLTQLIISWTIKQIGITHVLCGTKKLSHLIENAKSGNITLSDEDDIKIRNIANASNAIFKMFDE